MASEYTMLYYAAMVGLALVLVVRVLLIGRRRGDMPPGPPTLPIVGNLHQIPMHNFYARWEEWAEKYGGVFSLKLGNADTVVLCDPKAVHDLMDKKGAIYSDRPKMQLIEALGISNNTFVSQMNEGWKEKRKVISHNLSPSQLDNKHFLVQEAEATVLMHDFLVDPDIGNNYRTHLRRYTASIIHVLVHGFRAKSLDDFWGRAVFDVTHWRSVCQEPGAYPPVDQFPFLKYIPERFAAWKRNTRHSSELTASTWKSALQKIYERRQRGDKRACMADNLIEDYDKRGWPMEQIDFAKFLGEMVEGGADTSNSSMATLLLGMAKWPELQKKAHEEIDAICGEDRSPLWSDFEKLPYINALIKEGLRWRPIAPTGGPHRLREDNTYGSHLIPRDSTVFVGIWPLNHSLKRWASPQQPPSEFHPARYYDAGYTKLASHYAGSPNFLERDHYSYGAGRRICPGIHLAERNMWRTVAKLLWGFEFREGLVYGAGEVEDRGKRLSWNPEAYTGGLTREPLPFKLEIKIRSATRLETIKRELVEARKVLEAYE